jgi:hypothetical protein
MITTINNITNTETNLLDELALLENQRATLQILIDEAKYDIAQAKAKQKITGEYADPQWFADTQMSIHQETTNLHGINRQIKQIRNMLNKGTASSRAFQEAAKKILDQNTYNKILNMSYNV